MRINDHPILSFPETETITFSYQGREINAKRGETIAAALHNAGITELRNSGDRERGRGLFCAIGKCSSCLMKVDGVPNVRTCITMVQEGMEVEKQTGFPEIPSKSTKLKSEIIEKKSPEVLVIGGGPAGLRASLTAASAGASVLVIDENPLLGGQMIKQTHKFFGSSDQEAGERGKDIGDRLSREVSDHPEIEVMTSTSAVGIFEEKVGIYKNREKFLKVDPEKTIVATGATEDMIKFPNNDMPGVYGAGGVQTLMNVYGVKPGDRVLMVGAGNVGLIITYQLLQANVEVAAIAEIASEIGGYFVHAAKIRRHGIPIITDHRVSRVEGTEKVERAVIEEVGDSGEVIQGTEKKFDVDVVALAAGLSPSYKLLNHGGCELEFQPALGGHVPKRDKRMRTTREEIYVAGDASGIEEATSAMLEGAIAGADAALSIGKGGPGEEDIIRDAREKLEKLRAGSYYDNLRSGLQEVEKPSRTKEQ
ncbi:FAD-dependent oxidoreductase [Candidatus Bipolaricaulota bacterium]|nr:FAD-dependent oxidoreductase [Candidatus Bipolaricaulota bacterium]